MLSDEWLSRYELLDNFNASVTHTGTGTGMWTTGVTAIALCTSCSRAKNNAKYVKMDIFVVIHFCKFFLMQKINPLQKNQIDLQ